MYSPEVQNRITQLQEKALAGTLTLEDCRESILLLRQDRLSASQASAASKRAKQPVNTDQLFDELDKLGE